MTESLRAARLAAQGLTRPAPERPERVVRRLLAVQGQDLRAARLAVRARSTGLTVADVDEALTRHRSLVVAWNLRGTLHLVASEDHWWLHELTADRQRTGNRRRLAQEGVDPRQAARGVDVVAATLRDEGSATRARLRDRLDAAGVPTAGQALVHVLSAASIEGLLVRGPLVGAEQAFVDPATWIGPRPGPDRDAALARLAERYLRGHGPADAADLAKWSGLALGDTRRALQAVAGATEPWGDGRVVLAGTPRVPAADLPRPRLLGGFDPILHGWASRAEFVGDHGAVVTSNGIFRPTALVGGRVVATWGLPRGRVVLQPLEPIAPTDRRALEADAADVERFLGRRDE